MRNNLVFVVFDSCRFDNFLAAKTPNIDRLGETTRCYSYASWTVPSHTVYMMGVSPHQNPRGVFASEVYKKDFVRWGERLQIPDISFKAFLPHLSLPAFLKAHGYRTGALVSMPVLNQTTNFNRHFDRYQLMSSHNDFAAQIDEIEFDPGQPSFYLINVGETHYPYSLPGETNTLPRISGVHGVVKHMDDQLGIGSASSAKTAADEDQFFDMKQMRELCEKQRSNIEYLDRQFERLYQMAPANTHFIVTSDHGELFGEDGFFGHGPVIHEKVFEVFSVEGVKR
jgi:arylsulfatase A-like enzyme